jgi:Family of unknown function (DUF6152)
MGRRRIAVVLATFLAAGGPAKAHHSTAMFDPLRQVELDGVVREFRFTAPHTFIILDVRQKDGATVSWSLEGFGPSDLERDGWSRTSLKPGDRIKVTIEPLRSGVPGGLWITKWVRFHDGTPVVPTIERNEE